MQERRHFTRVIYRTPATLNFLGVDYVTNILDLSLKGALVSKPKSWPAVCDIDQPANLTFQLLDSELSIAMTVSVVHVAAEQLGLRCEQIGIESVSHLKRLIALNMGDEKELYREIEHLSVPSKDSTS